MSLNDVMQADIQGVFLNGDFDVTCQYTEFGQAPIEIRVQLFREALEKTESTYEHAWCAYADVPNLGRRDLFDIDGVTYGLLDYDIDEQKHGVNLFLNKVGIL